MDERFSDLLLAGLGFMIGVEMIRALDALVIERHPVVTEGELVVESEAAVVEAERIIRRSR